MKCLHLRWRISNESPFGKDVLMGVCKDCNKAREFPTKVTYPQARRWGRKTVSK